MKYYLMSNGTLFAVDEGTPFKEDGKCVVFEKGYVKGELMLREISGLKIFTAFIAAEYYG